MALNSIANYFFLHIVLKERKVKRSDFSVLLAIQMNEGNEGITRTTLYYYCKEHGFLASWKNFRRVVEPLILSGFIQEDKKKLSLSNKGFLQIAQVERSLKKKVQESSKEPVKVGRPSKAMAA